ncbi:hypothetical protein UFOVP1382_127 [uncultured Caudovirales phage]|uniref:Uncharacterized protein n=1 Tax=uncultured Caudovirales phage TaxID=2100421 RepID=A0A6J5RXN5_9CAUD|nr:hypothetical protein UFOVP1382_127 [uncultured Caudovirales phage]
MPLVEYEWGDPRRPPPTYDELWRERYGALARELGAEPNSELLKDAGEILSGPVGDIGRRALVRTIRHLRKP